MRITLLFCLFALFSLNSYSVKPYQVQLQDPLEESWRWQSFEELSGLDVRCMTEDAQGNMWFGIKGGIMKYDGYQWLKYDDKNGFFDVVVEHLITAKDNTIYAATKSGLFQLKNNKWSKIYPFTAAESKNFKSVNCITELRDGTILAGVGKIQSEYSALLLINKQRKVIYCSAVSKPLYQKEFKGQFVQTFPDNFLVNNHFGLSAIFQDRESRVWFSVLEPKFSGCIIASNSPSASGTDLFKTNKVYTEKDGIVLGRHAKFNQQADGAIWVVNIESDKPIAVFKNNSWQQMKLSSFVGYDEVHTSIMNGHGNSLWIGGFGVIYVRENGKWFSYTRPELPIPNTRILLYKDKKGDFWLLGYRYEVIKVDNTSNRWKSYKSINYQCTTPDKRKWFISVDDRVVVKQGNKWFSYGTEDGLPDAPTRVFVSRNGTVWVTGSDRSIAATSYLEAGKWHIETHPSLSWSIDNRAVYEDSNNQMWFGGSTNIVKEKGQQGGVLCLSKPNEKPHVWKHYPSTKQLEFRNAYGIAESVDGTIWTGGTMLRSFKNGKWSGIDDPDQANVVDIVKNSPNGLLWVGSRVLGVKSYDGKKWNSYDIHNGLLSNSVIDIMIKSDSDVYVATDKEFSHFDGKSWTNNIFPKHLTLIREQGDIVDGKDGTIWINMSSYRWKRRPLIHNHLNSEMVEAFRTYCYTIDKEAPDTKIVYCAEEIPYPGTTEIIWAGEDAWNHTANERLSYSYRINGGEWSPFMEKDRQTFIKLKSGDNILEVRARDLDFNIDPSPAVIEFYVDRPVWLQLWFLTLIAVFVIIIYFYQSGLYRRNARLEEAKQQLELKTVEILNQKEKIIQIAEREQESNRARIKFFTNISHEFRTPLTLILNSLERISSLDLDTERPALNKYLTMMQRNSKQMLRLINQLMEFRKADTNIMQLKVRLADIVKYVEDIVASFQSLVEQHNIRLELKSDTPELLTYFDADKIEKILYNLISNAVKFTPEKGLIRVSIYSDLSDESYSIKVHDTGIGIPQEEIDQILEPFYQANNKAIRNEEGTGIGLSLVNGLVKAHHGKLEVFSLGEMDMLAKSVDTFTTTFTITLPLGAHSFDQSEIVTDTATEEVETVVNTDIIENIDTAKLQTESKACILVVDDYKDIRELVMDTLGPLYTYVEAENGKEAFDKALEFQPDLIISDVMMPVMDGIEACSNLKADERTCHIPIMLLTANDGEEQMLSGLEIGADEYITKPFNSKVLILKVKNLLESRAILRNKFKNEISIEPTSLVISSLDAEFMDKLLAVVDENVKDENFDVEALSKVMNVSVRQLHNKLTALTDMSPGEFIRVYKLKRAAEFLLKKNTNISDVAYEFGFSNPKYFSKIFRQQFGMTPTEYLEKNNEK